MPSLQQFGIVQAETIKKSRIESKKPKKLLKMILLILLVVCGYVYYNQADTYVIPEEIYATRNNSMFKELFDTPYKKIIWFGANCPISAQRKKIIDLGLKYRKLDKHYIHRPFLQNSLNISCATEDCLDIFVMDKCGAGLCIIVPNEHKIIHTTYEHLARDMEKFKNL